MRVYSCKYFDYDTYNVGDFVLTCMFPDKAKRSGSKLDCKGSGSSCKEFRTENFIENYSQHLKGL